MPVACCHGNGHDVALLAMALWRLAANGATVSDHDQRFKALLQEFLQEFFELFFPDWAKWFDFSQVEWLDKEVFPDPPEGRRRAVDLVAKLPTIEPSAASVSETWLSLIHIEVESADSAAPLRRRMHRYYTHLRDRHDLPILPVAVYLRVGLEGIGIDDYTEAFGPLDVLRFKYLYVGLPGLDGVEYLQRQSDLAVALAALMRFPPEELARIKAESLLRLARSAQTEQRRFLLAECVQTYLNLPTASAQQEFERLLKQETFNEVKTMAVTWFDQGMEKGMEKGIAMGIALLAVQLEERFGALDPAVRDRLDLWPKDRLNELARQIVHAQSLEELGLK